MGYQYNPYLATQSKVIYELVNIVDAHSMGKIGHKELETLVNQFMSDYSELIFDIKEDKIKLKQFPRQKLGKKRIRIIGKCLEKGNLINDFNVDNAEFSGMRFVATA